MTFVSLLQQLCSQDKVIRFRAKKKLRNNFSIVRILFQNIGCLSAKLIVTTQKVIPYGTTHTYRALIREATPLRESKCIKKSNMAQNVCAPDTSNEQRSPCSLEVSRDYFNELLLCKPTSHKAIHRQAFDRTCAKGLRNSIACSPITNSPFILLAATAILCNPRLNDVSMIPDSLFCRSRDWATISAT